MVTEAGYPYYRGGVSVWCDRLIRDLPDVSFRLVSFVASPRIDMKYELPPNVTSCAKVPLWGIREVLESRETLTIEELRRRRRDTTEALIRRVFLPSFRAFVEELYEETASSKRLVSAILGLHRFFIRYDFDTALRSHAVWECFVELAQERFAQAIARIGYRSGDCTLADVTEAMTLLYRWLIPLAMPLPTADLVHATSVGLPSLAAIAAKLKDGSPVLLTEHGVFLRERCLQEIQSPSRLFVKLLGIRFAVHITALSYELADQISPGSNYNRRWELRGGASARQLTTIYNGVDPDSFRPAVRPDTTPLVVWVGRITPMKDLITLIRSAAVVHASRPDVRFALYGAAPEGDEDYYRDCQRLVRELGLEGVVEFRGYVPSAEEAFNQGDIVVMSSISEGFPYSMVEAMLCEKPIVATAVGGVPEAIEGCGIPVQPRDPQALADGVLRLLNDPKLRLAMGRAAREKAASKFNLRQCATAYDESYRRLAGGTGSSRTGLAVPIASAFDALSLQSGTVMQGVAP
jgi:glycosyltransferase involved in cell wall biosynthesis